MTTTDEQLVLSIRMGRDEFAKFEQVLQWYERYGERRYTPETYFADVIEREYARVI
jgi:hypothetical protein